MGYIRLGSPYHVTLNPIDKIITIEYTEDILEKPWEIAGNLKECVERLIPFITESLKK
jgi:hypothetical protein